MAPRVNEALLNAMPRTAEEWLSAKGEPITVEHRCANPGGRNKTTAYTFDLEDPSDPHGSLAHPRGYRMLTWWQNRPAEQALSQAKLHALGSKKELMSYNIIQYYTIQYSLI
jgi:hypothetical protein